MRVITVPCRTDNFTYLISSEESGRDVAVVDPCEPRAVLEAIEAENLRVTAILNTHHHGDHVGGNKALLERFPGIPVYAHSSDEGRIPGQTHFLEEGEELDAAGLHFKVLFIPGHTLGHIAYLTEGAAFVGDTVFAGGCGRLFEGDAAMMNDSINHKVAKLPPETELYFAHEYTQANLRFAAFVDPENPHLHDRIKSVNQLRKEGRWTTPTTVAEEIRTNPFFRVREPALIEHFAADLDGNTDPASVFGAVRAAKDSF